MTEQHPITPSPELVEQWTQMKAAEPEVTRHWNHIATRAARWGADQELEACAKWLGPRIGWATSADLRADRRPKPPSLKESALALLSKANGPVMLGTPEYRLSESDADIIRCALESLPS